MKVFFDGGCRPEGMELAVMIAGEAQVERDLGPGTSMTAEWLALLAAMRIAAARGLTRPVLLGDGAAVIAQANGRVRCPPAHRGHLAAFRELAAALPGLRVRYVKRTQNLAGIVLQKRAASATSNDRGAPM